MRNLVIETAENGFIIYEDNGRDMMVGKKWAFETAESLAGFVKDWGKSEQERPIKEKAGEQNTGN